MAVKNKIKLIEKKAKSLYRRLQKCDICPKNCKVNRLKDKKGYCGTAKDLIAYTSFLHNGEEPGVSGRGGSGTIFFSGCNLKCVYCQNYKFSHFVRGKTISEDDLSKFLLNLQKEGAENINLVTPTHFLPQILKAVLIAFKKGLNIPLVYNTSGYEKKEVIARLKGVIDIYLTDMKYITSSLADKYSISSNYPLFCRKSIKEMYRQRKKALWAKNVLKKGLIIRHLVLPGHIQESKKILSWIKKNTPQAIVSIMFQYQPYFKANLYPEINRKITFSEYSQIKEFSEKLRLKGWVQEFNSQECLAGPYFEPELQKHFK